MITISLQRPGPLLIQFPPRRRPGLFRESFHEIGNPALRIRRKITNHFFQALHEQRISLSARNRNGRFDSLDNLASEARGNPAFRYFTSTASDKIRGTLIRFRTT